MKKNSAIHSLSADKRLSTIKKISWIFFNFINNNLRPKEPNIKNKFIREFHPSVTSKEIQEMCSGKSPSRTIGDLFWKELDWIAIKKELGEINIFDTGCGAGNYGLMLNHFANGINSYKGIDFKERSSWSGLMKKYKFLSFEESSSSNVEKLFKKDSNLLITQSAIEHFDKDLEYFYQIRNLIKKSKNNILQIHLFPSPACLWLYLFHGIRQYNINSINKIVSIFNNTKSYIRIYPLGGDQLNKVHFRNITFPRLIGKSINLNSCKYKLEIEKALGFDNQRFSKNPSFYALIIHSNYKNKIFI